MTEAIKWGYDGDKVISTNVLMTGIGGCSLPVYRYHFDRDSNLWIAKAGYNNLGAYDYSHEAMYACEDHYETYLKESNV